MKGINSAQNTYLISGESSSTVASLLGVLPTALDFVPRGNVDFWHGVYAQFTIDESRFLKSLQSTKPFGPKRVMIVETLTMTTEAQQAILKLSEELSGDMYLFIVLPSIAQLLPTLRSRFVHIALEEDTGDAKVAAAFLGGNWGERTKVIEKITKEKDKKRAFALLSGVEHALMSDRTRYAKPLAEVLVGKRRVLEGIVPLKMALESVALSVPRV